MHLSVLPRPSLARAARADLYFFYFFSSKNEVFALIRYLVVWPPISLTQGFERCPRPCKCWIDRKRRAVFRRCAFSFTGCLERASWASTHAATASETRANAAQKASPTVLKT